MPLNAQTLRARRRARRGPLNDINIAPFVDVMLVLVVIFMVAAPLVSLGVPIDLPKATVNPINAEREPLVVSIDRDGRIFIQETEVPPEALVPRLVAVSRGTSRATGDRGPSSHGHEDRDTGKDPPSLRHRHGR